MQIPARKWGLDRETSGIVCTAGGRTQDLSQFVSSRHEHMPIAEILGTIYVGHLVIFLSYIVLKN